MKNLLNKGKSLVAIVSVFAVLAVSMLSIFTGLDFTATASKAGTDYDVWDNTTSASGDWYDTELAGSGTATDPYLITSCEELAAVATGAVTTDGLYFKVADGIGAFYMAGGETVANLTSAAEVKEWFDANGSSCRVWWAKGKFMGNFDGNGATVYGLYTTETQQAAFGLFHVVDGATIKNIAVKNFCSLSNEGSSFTGGIFGNASWGTNRTTTIENCIVENCYLASSSTYSGAIGGHAASNTVNIKNCYVSGNTVINGWGNVDERLIGYSDSLVNVDGVVAIGDAALSQASSVNQTNVYTTVTLQNAVNGVTTVSDYTGAAVVEAMPGLDWDFTWFANDGAPMLRAFHTFTGTSVGVDGHTEKTSCCDVAGVINTKHIYTIDGACATCGYTYPCTAGHAFEFVEAVEATGEHAGNIAYQHCTVCDKDFAADAAVTAPVDSALTQAQIIIPQILPYDIWDGTWDEYFWMNNEGDGSPASPFIISTAEQLGAVTTARLRYDASKETSADFDIDKYTISGGLLNTTGLFFKVKNGIEAFYMNGEQAIEELSSAAEVKEYFDANVPTTNWWVGDVFRGNFNGNGATVYGLYANKESAGLFPIIGPDVVVKNISVKNSYFAAYSTDYIQNTFTGGIFGQVQWYQGISSAASVTVRNSSVINCYLESKNHYVNAGEDVYTDAGAIGGHIRELKLKVKNCLVYGNEIVNVSGSMGGAVGEGWSVTDEIVDSVFIGTAPFSVTADKSRAKGESFSNVYTDVDLTEGEALAAKYYGKESFEYTENQIKKLETSQMLGDAAKTNMAVLDWEKLWQTNTDSYPTPRLLSIKDYAPGYVWSGEIAEEFPAGEGTKSNPYKISTPEYLALMLNMDSEGLHYELTADIMINDTSAENWKDTAKQWYTSNDIAAFKGILEGAGYTISGLYIDEVPANTYAGLIPVADSATINNLTVADSYVSGNADSYVGAMIGGIVDNSEKPIYMQGNTVEADVVIEGTGVSGGIVGKCGNSILRMGNCISKATIISTDATGGLVAVTGGGVSVKNSISTNTAPFGSADAVVATNVYTNVTGSVRVDGVTVLATADMQGEAAKTNMTGLDFDTIWSVVDGDYPTLAGVIDTSNGTVGDVWTGDIASGYAGGTGTVEDPYLIATGEQLALCVTNNGDGKHYKLTADIYLNDVNSPLWEDKIGCNEWFNSKTGSKWASLKNGSFNGDGYVIYGLYYNRVDLEENSAFNGLFATIGEAAVIENVGISNAYMAGSIYSGDNFNEFMGALTGYVVDWDDIEGSLPSSDANVGKAITSDPAYQARQPVIRNCFVDHNSYLSGRCVGGLVGAAHGSFRIENSIFTGSLKGKDNSNTAGMIGQDMGNGGYYLNNISFPQTCDRPLGGSANSDWRQAPGVFVSTVEDMYYFSMYRVTNNTTKISKPEQRVGTAAQEAMPGLDWVGITDDGTEEIWTVVEGGTPLQAIFAEKHTEEEFISFSDRSFSAPEVTVNLITGTTEVEFEPLVGKMYSKMELPTPTRPGFKFTGWYPHSNLSVEYPYDYFPPRSLNLYAGWEAVGIICNFENYTDTIWDYDDTRWVFNKPGARGGYKNAYVRNGSKSMHLLDTSAESADVLLNYDPMLEVGKSYTMTLWVTTDRADNPATQLSLVHNSKPVYLDTGIAIEDMVIVKGLTVGEWTQYTYSFTAQTKWVSIRATGNSSLYFDDIIIAPIEGTVNSGNLVYLGTGGADGSGIAPNTGDNTVSVAVLISAIMACAVVVVISRKNLVEIIED